jgi:hypothetical protein
MLLMLTRLLMRTRVQAITVSYSQQKLSITPIHTSPTLTEAFKANVKVRPPLRRYFCEEVANQLLCVRQVINKYSPYGSTAALRVALDKIQVPLCSSSCIERALRFLWFNLCLSRAQGTGTHVVVYNLRKPEQTDEPCEFSLADNVCSSELVVCFSRSCKVRALC